MNHEAMTTDSGYTSGASSWAGTPDAVDSFRACRRGTPDSRQFRMSQRWKVSPVRSLSALADSASVLPSARMAFLVARIRVSMRQS